MFPFNSFNHLMFVLVALLAVVSFKQSSFLDGASVQARFPFSQQKSPSSPLEPSGLKTKQAELIGRHGDSENDQVSHGDGDGATLTYRKPCRSFWCRLREFLFNLLLRARNGTNRNEVMPTPKIASQSQQTFDRPIHPSKTMANVLNLVDTLLSFKKRRQSKQQKQDQQFALKSIEKSSMPIKSQMNKRVPTDFEPFSPANNLDGQQIFWYPDDEWLNE